MRIGILTNEYPPNVYGGAGVHVEYLTRELAKLIEARDRIPRHAFSDALAASADPGFSADTYLGDGQITGHTAGKTTFCRFIRYLLGEQRFGTARAQERIREALAASGRVAAILAR